MKIAITGHTAGIGQAFTKILESRGHEIVGISRRTGDNIRRIEHTANLIEPCEMFINNAQTQYTQTELLYAVWQRWQGKEKYIWKKIHIFIRIGWRKIKSIDITTLKIITQIQKLK